MVVVVDPDLLGVVVVVEEWPLASTNGVCPDDFNCSIKASNPVCCSLASCDRLAIFVSVSC